jgi:hypothetical protein
VELHALAQLEAEGRSVVQDLVAGGQRRLELVDGRVGERVERLVDVLDERTGRRRVSESAGNERRFTAEIDDLDRDERYYFRAVAATPNGERFYGTTQSFRTDYDRDRDDDDDDDDEADTSLIVSDSRIDVGDEITVLYEYDNGDAHYGWIGLYETGEDDRDYVDWEWVREEEGELEFTVDERGEYEFRLFSGNGYDRLTTSREFDVE